MMIEKIKRLVFLLVVILAMFTLSVENASADSDLPDMHNADSEQGEIYLAANHTPQPQHQEDVDRKGMKNDINAQHMMGHGDMEHGWMWGALMIVLMVIMMA